MSIKTKKKTYKWLTLSFLAFGILLSGGFLIISIFYPDILIPDINENNNDSNYITLTNLSLTVDFGNSSVFFDNNLTFSDRNPTVFNLLDSLFSIEFESYSNGYLITSINGIRNNPSEDANWFYWINGISPNIASSNYYLSNGDKILWNYTSWSLG